jgi:hypothetical protein
MALVVANALFVAVMAPACSTARMPPRTPVSCPDPSTKPLVVTKLFFGLSSKNGRGVSDQAWDRFVAAAVTPRFPEGFTVLKARGQYLSTGGTTEVEVSRVIVRVHSGTLEDYRKIEAIAEEYSRAFDQESVLRVDSEECGHF